MVVRIQLNVSAIAKRIQVDDIIDVLSTEDFANKFTELTGAALADIESQRIIDLRRYGKGMWMYWLAVDINGNWYGFVAPIDKDLKVDLDNIKQLHGPGSFYGPDFLVNHYNDQVIAVRPDSANHNWEVYDTDFNLVSTSQVANSGRAIAVLKRGNKIYVVTDDGSLKIHNLYIDDYAIPPPYTLKERIWDVSYTDWTREYTSIYDLGMAIAIMAEEMCGQSYYYPFIKVVSYDGLTLGPEWYLPLPDLASENKQIGHPYFAEVYGRHYLFYVAFNSWPQGRKHFVIRALRVHPFDIFDPRIAPYVSWRVLAGQSGTSFSKLLWTYGVKRIEIDLYGVANATINVTGGAEGDNLTETFYSGSPTGNIRVAITDPPRLVKIEISSSTSITPRVIAYGYW